MRERAADVFAEGAPWTLNGAVASGLVRCARRHMHAPSVAHRLVLTHDEIGRVVAVQVPNLPHAHVAHPREEQVRALGRLDTALRLLEVEAVDAGSVVVVPADDLLAAVDVIDVPHTLTAQSSTATVLLASYCIPAEPVNGTRLALAVSHGSQAPPVMPFHTDGASGVHSGKCLSFSALRPLNVRCTVSASNLAAPRWPRATVGMHGVRTSGRMATPRH